MVPVFLHSNFSKHPIILVFGWYENFIKFFYFDDFNLVFANEKKLHRQFEIILNCIYSKYPNNGLFNNVIIQIRDFV